MARTNGESADARSTVDLDKLIGERVRIRRMQLQVSQTALAGALGLTFQQVQKYETGSNRIGSGRLVKIARILECDVSDFFDGSGKKKIGASTPLTQFLATKDGFDIVEAFMKINSHSLRRSMISLARALSGR